MPPFSTKTNQQAQAFAKTNVPSARSNKSRESFENNSPKSSTTTSKYILSNDTPSGPQIYQGAVVQVTSATALHSIPGLRGMPPATLFRRCNATVPTRLTSIYQCIVAYMYTAPHFHTTCNQRDRQKIRQSDLRALPRATAPHPTKATSHT